jgi:hypothetical protein
LLTCSAVFGVSDGDQVVDKIDGANFGKADPFLEPGIVEAGVADVEIESPVT